MPLLPVGYSSLRPARFPPYIIANDKAFGNRRWTVIPSKIKEYIAQQIKEATPFGMQPEYLIYDNDSIFISKELLEFLTHAKIQSVRTGYHSPWQNGICERTVVILRRELLDSIVPFNEKHLEYLLGEYIHHYFNPSRTHQGIERQTPIKSESSPQKTSVDETQLSSEPILSRLYHNYRKTA